MANASNNQVCLEYQINRNAQNPESVKKAVFQFVTRLIEDSTSTKLSVTEDNNDRSRITVYEYWRDRDEFQKSKAYESIMDLYDNSNDVDLPEPVRVTFWDEKIGSFSVWF